MKQIRIILAEMPPMLVDIVSEIIAAEPDLDIVDVLPGKTDLDRAARLARADVVVVQQIGEPQKAEAPRLTSCPFKVLAISEDGRQGRLYELRPQCTSLGEMSATDLVTAIKAAAGREYS